MKKILLLLLLVFLGVTANAQSIVINDPADPETNYTAEELIENVLLSGSLECVSVELTNLQENPGGVSNLSQRSWGYFKSDGADFPFEEGIILSSGYAVNAEGPNNSTASSDIGTGWPGDNDLTTLLNNEYGDNSSTNNATVFEFTFTSALEEVAFDFIFASEEYENSFECSVSLRDGFAFFISGPGIGDTSGVPFGGENIGNVPYTDVPVNTGSIHLDTFNCGNQVQNVDFFPLYYVSNSPVNDPSTVAHEFDGRTISLTARANIIPGEEYTMKMVIADRGDSSYDSAVFLRAGSLNIGEVDLGEDILISTGEANCEGDVVTLSAGEYVSSADYIWYQDGVEIAGAETNVLEVTETGTYLVEVYYSDTCIVDDEVVVEFFPNPEIELGEDLLMCPDEPITLNATPTNAAELQDVEYTWYVNWIEQAETSATFQATSGAHYFVEVTSFGNCVASDELIITEVDFAVTLEDPIILCGEGPLEIIPQVWGEEGSTPTYEWSTGETTSSISVTQAGEYWVDVTINGCTERATTNVTFNDYPQVNLGEDFSKCSGDVVQIDATPSNVSTGVTYTWYFNGNEITGSNAATIDVIDEGTYMVEVENNGCVGTSDIVVSNYQIDNCSIPQGISPNGDNVNDCVDLQFLDDELGIQSFKLYNRHGRLVFDMENYVNEFCGVDKDGNELPTGTYYYVMKLNNTNQIYQQVETGWIYINREI